MDQRRLLRNRFLFAHLYTHHDWGGDEPAGPVLGATVSDGGGSMRLDHVQKH